MKKYEYKTNTPFYETPDKRKRNPGSYNREDLFHDNKKDVSSYEKTVLKLINMFDGKVVTTSVKAYSINNII